MTKVKYPLLNILIGLLIVAMIAILFVPAYTVGEKTLSVMGYLSFPTDHKDVTKMFESIYEDFNINREVWWLLLTQIAGICSLVLMALYPAQKKSLAMPILFSVIGIGTICANRLVHVSGFTAIEIVLLVAVLLLSLYNADLIHKISKRSAQDHQQNQQG